jgi:uridylate kinase
MKKLFVLSLGGSLIVPDKIDADFLKKFRSLILKQIKKGNRFIIITGGGKICRNYQQTLKSIAQPTSFDLDWLGIYSTRFNAQLVRLMFKNYAHPKIIENTNKKIKFREKILLAGGWIPGRSTDDDAVRLAKAYQANTIINLSNIDSVYDRDPKKFKNAEKIKQISWNDFMKIVGDKWKPGANLPFDPTAAKLARKFKLKVIITNGKNLKNLQKILNGQRFQGTVIY